MQSVFLKILSIGMNASWMILAILCLRIVFWKSPKWIACFMWFLVGIRLLCPYNIESTISLVPIQMEVPLNDSEKNTLKDEKDMAYIRIERNSFIKRNRESEKHIYQSNNTDRIRGDKAELNASNALADSIEKQVMLNSSRLRFFAVVWVCGLFAMLLYFVLSCFYLSNRTKTATYFKENIWESEFVISPYIFGVFCPKIYIPYGIDEEQLVYVLAHERAHLKRKDHILKVVAYFILSIYWFHPLVWVAYVCLGRDIEYACDEKAVLNMDKRERKNYLLALLNCCAVKRRASVYPLAFGKIGIKKRVIRMKQWKKPSIVLFTITMLFGMIVSVCCFTVPKTRGAGEMKNQEEINTGFVTLDIKPASVNLNENTGADGTILYYVDAGKIIFGGTYGLFVYDKNSRTIVQSLDLEYIECNYTQGDNYCEIAVDKNGGKIYLNPVRKKKLYILDLISNTLEIRNYPNSDIWKDNSLELFHVENAKQVSYHDGGEEKICKLNENDFTIGSCSYTEYPRKESNNKGELMYYPLFAQ